MSLPKPPSPNAPLPFDGSLDEPTIADYAALGWAPVDIRTSESSLETCRLVLLGLRMGTVSLDKQQMEALELEIRVNGGFTAKAGETGPKQGAARDLNKDEIDVLSVIPTSQRLEKAEKEVEVAKRLSKASRQSLPEPKGPDPFAEAVTETLLHAPRTP